MSRSIGSGRPVFPCAPSAPGADNDRGPGQRQARLRSAAAAAALALLVAMPVPAALGEDDATGPAPLEIQRQQIDGRLGTIERKQEDLGRAPVGRSRLDPDEATPAPRPSETRGARNRLELERRTLQGQRDSIDRRIERRGDNPTPSTGGLLQRLRRE
ncbi:MAG: hypothetical protein U0S49_08230 [Rhodospirillales bacterium]|nr:hypothetical protein [Rhodospirillales bacterium]